MPVCAGAFVTPHLGALIEPHWFVFGAVGFYAAIIFCVVRLFSRRAGIVVCAFVVGVLMVMAHANNRLWSDEKRYYQAWLIEAPEFKAIHYFLGLTYEREDDRKKAYEHLERAVIGRYKDWMVYLELGLIDLRSGRLERAEENLRKSFALEKDHSDVLNAMGALAYRKGSLEEARYYWERSIKRNPLNWEPRMNMAAYYAKVGDLQKAAAVYHDLLNRSPDFVPARKALSRLEGRP